MKRPPAAARLRILTPATTANLGPGFDCLGLALDLFNEFRLARRSGRGHRWIGRGTCAHLTTGTTFFRAYRRVCRLAEAPMPALEVEVIGRIPVGRGLGSSATAIVAGALAANLHLGGPLSPEELLLTMARLEGHPDNVAAAFLGGLTAASLDGPSLMVHAYRPHPVWRVVVHAPDYALPTEQARRALPAQVPHRDAVFNLSRVPLLIDAIVAGEAEPLRWLMTDRLHEPYRRRFVRDYARLRARAVEAGAAGVFLSGAGPSLAAFCHGESTARKVAAAMSAGGRKRAGHAQTLLLRLARGGTAVRG